MLKNLREAPYRSLMAASGSLSSLLLSKSHSFLPPISKPNCKSYNTNLGSHRPSRTQSVKFSVNSEYTNNLSDDPVAEKKSLKVSDGESKNKLSDEPFAVKKSFTVFNGGSRNKLSEDLVAEKISSEAATAESENKLGDDPSGERRSLAVAFGELCLGIASRLTKRKDGNGSLVSMPVETFKGTEDLKKGAYVKERIASVLEDSVDSGVPWEQSLKDVEAENKPKKITSPGFSFSAAGLLFPYHLGVAQLLIEKGYIKETTPLAGSSAGAIVCAVVASGSSMQEALKATKILAEDCRRGGTAFRLEAVLRNVLQDFLPDDVHSRSNGRIRVAVTQLLWRPKGLLVDQFDSREDLIDAVITSSFIPGYLAPWPATKFRNRLCIDGGLTLFMPPTSAAQTVRVCAFPANQMRLKGIEISPHCNPDNRATTRQLFQWALEPADDHILDRLFEFGYLDATVWAQQNPVEEILEDQSNPNRSQVQNDSIQKDIHPGPGEL